MPFSHNGLKTTTGIQVFSQVNKYTLSCRFLYGNVQRCVFAKNRPVSLNWTDYKRKDLHKSDLDYKYHYLASAFLLYTDLLYSKDADVNNNF